MIDFLIAQLTQSLFCCYYIVFVILNSINNVIIGNAALYYVILFLHVATSSTVYHILKPFNVVRLKYLDTETIFF